MKILFYSLVIVAGFAGVIAVRLRHRIRSKALRITLSLLGATGIFALAVEELYKLTNGFEIWGNLLGLGFLVPFGWFAAGCFVFFYAFEGGVLKPSNSSLNNMNQTAETIAAPPSTTDTPRAPTK